MSGREANELLGRLNAERRTVLRAAGLNVEVRLLDVRCVWGNVHVLVTPVAGTGETWVAESTLRSARVIDALREAGVAK